MPGMYNAPRLTDSEDGGMVFFFQANNSVGPGNSCSYTVLRSSLGIAHKITAAVIIIFPYIIIQIINIIIIIMVIIVIVIIIMIIKIMIISRTR